MSPLVHKIYVATMVAIVILTFVYLIYNGYSYYETSIEERFYHTGHAALKPSGIYGHGLGIFGTLMILIGVVLYIARKRYGFLARIGRLKYWLEFHIFLCSLGPVLVLFHTAFKFGGIVSVSFWSMVAVVASGVIGRFIYIQIPRTIEGRELSLSEVKDMKSNIEELIRKSYAMDEASYDAILATTRAQPQTAGGSWLFRMSGRYFEDKRTLGRVKRVLRHNNIPGKEIGRIVVLLKNEISLNNRIERLQTMQNLFRYWHVAHLPFAVIMLIIAIIHVGVTLAFGYKWIF